MFKHLINKIVPAIGTGLLSLCIACSSGDGLEESVGDNGTQNTPPTARETSFELSYWIDMDLFGNHLRGYWYNVDERNPENIPEPSYVQNTCNRLSDEYGANKLYVVYHRQFDIDDAEYVMRMWKSFGDKKNLKIVPTVVLQSYANPQQMNFPDDMIIEFAQWCMTNINSDEFGIYDVYTRDAQGSTQDFQLQVIKAAIGDKLVRVGLQPGISLNSVYKAGVEDTWTAECQGRTNELWENPVFYRGHKKYGRILLEEWVNERVNGESRPIVWDMIPVAWDYETDDELSYDCPGDDQFKNDPPVPGRIALCHKYISGCYTGGMDNEKFGGYSCDLHILQANSGGRGEKPSFYEALRTNVSYNGDFSEAMTEIGDLYKSLK